MLRVPIACKRNGTICQPWVAPQFQPASTLPLATFFRCAVLCCACIGNCHRLIVQAYRGSQRETSAQAASNSIFRLSAVNSNSAVAISSSSSSSSGNSCGASSSAWTVKPTTHSVLRGHVAPEKQLSRSCIFSFRQPGTALSDAMQSDSKLDSGSRDEQQRELLVASAHEASSASEVMLWNARSSSIVSSSIRHSRPFVDIRYSERLSLLGALAEDCLLLHQLSHTTTL